MSLSATSTCLLNTIRNDDSTTSLGNLFQCLITLPVNFFFLISNLNHSWCSLRLDLHCVITCYQGEENSPYPDTPFSQAVVESDELPPQPPFLQAKELQLPQLLLIRFDFANKYYNRCLQLGCQKVIIIIMNTYRPG